MSEQTIRAVVKEVAGFSDAEFEAAKQGNWPVYLAASKAYAAAIEAARPIIEAEERERCAEQIEAGGISGARYAKIIRGVER